MKEQGITPIVSRMAADPFRRMIEEILPEVQARAELLGEVRDALTRGEDTTALVLMRRYCGLTPNLSVAS